MSILLHSTEQRQAQRRYVVDVFSGFDAHSAFFADDIRLRNDCEVRIRHDYADREYVSSSEAYRDWSNFAAASLPLATTYTVQVGTHYPRKIEGVKPIYQRPPRPCVFLTLKFLFPVEQCPKCFQWERGTPWGQTGDCWVCQMEADKAFQAQMESMATTPDELDFVKAVLAKGGQHA